MTGRAHWHMRSVQFLMLAVQVAALVLLLLARVVIMIASLHFWMAEAHRLLMWGTCATLRLHQRQKRLQSPIF